MSHPPPRPPAWCVYLYTFNSTRGIDNFSLFVEIIRERDTERWFVAGTWFVAQHQVHIAGHHRKECVHCYKQITHLPTITWYASNYSNLCEHEKFYLNKAHFWSWTTFSRPARNRSTFYLFAAFVSHSATADADFGVSPPMPCMCCKTNNFFIALIPDLPRIGGFGVAAVESLAPNTGRATTVARLTL